MQVLLVHYTVEAGAMEGVLDDFRAMCEQVAKDEPGCLTYRIHRDPERPDDLWLYEAYEDQAAMDAHMATPHFKQYVVERIRSKVSGRERWLLTPAEEAAR